MTVKYKLALTFFFLFLLKANEDKDMEGVVLIPEEDSLSQNNTEAR